MKKVIVGPTEVAIWQNLVSEAGQLRTINLHQDLESYLVFLLMRFTQSSHLFSTVLGIDFLTAINNLGQVREQQLREVGDQCLLLSGLFPGRVQRKRLELSYFVSLGKTAYASACTKSHSQTAVLFAALGEAFVPLMDVLQALRTLEQGQSTMTALDEASLWFDNLDPHALNMWQRDHDSQLVLDPQDKEHKRH
jgi:hypothetical protein